MSLAFENHETARNACPRGAQLMFASTKLELAPLLSDHFMFNSEGQFKMRVSAG